MNRLIKKTFTAFAALTLVLCVALAGCSPKVTEPRVYIALGDSVSSGFGVEPKSRHTDLFYERLLSEGLADEFHNYAANGYTTSMLLDYLTCIEDLEIFANACVITINIGGNNVLAPFMEFLPNVDELTNDIAQLAVFISEAQNTMAAAIDMVSEVQELIDNFSILDILELVSFMQEAFPLLEDVTGTLREGAELDIVKLFSLLLGSFPDELDAAFQEGLDTFSVEFTEIIKWLKINAPNAVIIVNTVYNPIPQDSHGLLSGMHNKAAELTESINSIILRGQTPDDYLVSDVCGRFNDEPVITDILNFDLNMETMTLNFDIIHPNSKGHEIIAELNHKSLEDQLS